MEQLLPRQNLILNQNCCIPFLFLILASQTCHRSNQKMYELPDIALIRYYIAIVQVQNTRILVNDYDHGFIRYKQILITMKYILRKMFLLLG